MLRPGSWSLGDKGTHYIKTIKNSSNHLATLINDILDAAAMAKGKLVIKQETVSCPVILNPFSCMSQVSMLLLVQTALSVVSCVVAKFGSKHAMLLRRVLASQNPQHPGTA